MGSKTGIKQGIRKQSADQVPAVDRPPVEDWKDGIALDSIKANAKNPRKISEKKFEQLKESIREFPEMMRLRPIIVDENDTALGGNMRYHALKAIGYKTIPRDWVKKIEGLSEAQKREFLIKDNLSFGEWSWDILKEWDLPEVERWGLDLPTYKIDGEAEEDNFEIPEHLKTDIIAGELFEIGPHRILCGDARNPDDWSRLLQQEMVDIVITDPPYNVDYTGKTKDRMKIENDKQSTSTFYNFLLDFFTALKAHARPGSSWYVWHAETEGATFRNAYIDSGLLLKQCLIWVKNAMVMGRQDYQWRHEPCIYGWTPGAAHYFTPERHHTTVIEDQVDISKMKKDEMQKLLEEIFEDRIPTTVLRHDKPSRSELHPTMKPVLLIADHLKKSSKPGFIVADGFGGSGTTMVAAHQLKRSARLMELDPRFVQVTIDRMRKLDPEIKITRNGKPYDAKVVKAKKTEPEPEVKTITTEGIF